MSMTGVFALATIVLLVEPMSSAFGSMALVKTKIDNIGQRHPKFRQELEAIQKRDVVIFIPGILGSKLKDPRSGKIIWGGRPPSVQEIALKTDTPPAEAEILEEYFSDVYKEAMEALTGVLGSERLKILFPYDWRRNLEEVAAELDEKIRNNWRGALAGKRVTIIAHSMGGLVTWIWKNRYYEQKGGHEFRDLKIILLGTPLEGSCEILRMMLSGYRPIPGSPRAEELGYQVLFGELRAALYTFPSVFQLLPLFEERALDLALKTICLVVETPQSWVPIDHFDPSSWETFLSPVLQGSHWLLRWLLPFFASRSVWEDLDMSQEDFLALLTKMLETSKRFRGSLNLAEGALKGKVRYFYSDKHRTTSQVLVRGNSVDSSHGVLSRGGDGRVLQSSATNGDFSTSDHILPPLGAPHGGLVKDASFISWLRIQFYSEIRAEQVKDSLFALWTDEEGQRELRIQQVSTSLSDIGIDPLHPPTGDGRVHAIVDLNATVLRDRVSETRPDLSQEELPFQPFKFATYLHNRGLPREAISFYELALATRKLPKVWQESAITRSVALRWNLLLQEGDYIEAQKVIKNSLERLTVDPNLKPYVLNDLGVTYEYLGNRENAIALYQLAAKFGSEVAKRNLARLGIQ